MYENVDKELITFVAKIAVVVGLSTYGTVKSYSNRQEARHQMEWIADHHAIYGNRNGTFDLEEKLGVLKDLNIKNRNDVDISIREAKQYRKLYSNSVVTR